MYGDMPLIEELEYKEELRITDFVIAVDTSGSTSGDLVRSFLTRTQEILTELTAGRTLCNLWILQADAEVQEAVRITNREDLQKYGTSRKIHGFGGTDFRPVFAFVERLREQGEIKKLQGLLYFTDGYGTYPARRPDYPVAFVFAAPDAVLEKVPAWAIKVILNENDFREMEG